jgi:hypothetical protein
MLFSANNYGDRCNSSGKEHFTMAKVLGMHMIDLRPGVRGEELERFFREKVAPFPAFPGWKMSLLKGDRGDREGRYLVLIEMESVEARNRFASTSGQPSEEGERFIESQRAMLEEWAKLASPIGTTIYTDYVVVA